MHHVQMRVRWWGGTTPSLIWPLFDEIASNSPDSKYEPDNVGCSSRKHTLLFPVKCSMSQLCTYLTDLSKPGRHVQFDVVDANSHKIIGTCVCPMRIQNELSAVSDFAAAMAAQNDTCKIMNNRMEPVGSVCVRVIARFHSNSLMKQVIHAQSHASGGVGVPQNPALDGGTGTGVVHHELNMLHAGDGTNDKVQQDQHVSYQRDRGGPLLHSFELNEVMYSTVTTQPIDGNRHRHTKSDVICMLQLMAKHDTSNSLPLKPEPQTKHFQPDDESEMLFQTAGTAGAARRHQAKSVKYTQTATSTTTAASTVLPGGGSGGVVLAPASPDTLNMSTSDADDVVDVASPRSLELGTISPVDKPPPQEQQQQQQKQEQQHNHREQQQHQQQQQPSSVKHSNDSGDAATSTTTAAATTTIMPTTM